MAKQNQAAGTSPVTARSVEEETRSLAYQLYCEGGSRVVVISNTGCELSSRS
jgi:hypothetical protein